MVQGVIKGRKRRHVELYCGHSLGSMPMAADECRHDGVPEVLSGFPAAILSRRSDAIMFNAILDENRSIKGGHPAAIARVA